MPRLSLKSSLLCYRLPALWRRSCWRCHWERDVLLLPGGQLQHRRHQLPHQGQRNSNNQHNNNNTIWLIDWNQEEIDLLTIKIELGLKSKRSMKILLSYFFLIIESLKISIYTESPHNFSQQVFSFSERITSVLIISLKALRTELAS